MLSVSHVRKSFGAQTVLESMNLEVPAGKFFCLLGPSGCGKTTLLRIIAGLETADEGRIVLNGQDITQAAPDKRHCALVFQSYALWPHLTVFDNIGYGLQRKRKGKSALREAVQKQISAFQLEGLESRFPPTLSGGQQQRVALARAMAMEPRLLLLDEPFSHLDAVLRRQLRRELKAFQRRTGATVIHVTHDQEEAMALADEMAILLHGRLMETGRPADLYAKPQNLETAAFLGEMNVLPGEVDPRGHFRWQGHDLGLAPKSATTLCLRPEHIRLGGLGDKEKSEGKGLIGRVAFHEYAGHRRQVAIKVGEAWLWAQTEATGDLADGQEMRLEWDEARVLWY